MGTFKDMAKGVAKNKAKSAAMGALKAALPYILAGVAIIFGILLIAGLFMAIISAIGDVVTDVVSAIGEFFAGIGNWFASLFDPDSGKFIITINEQKFEELKSTLAASGIDAEASNLTDECLKIFLLAQYKTQYPEDVVIKIEVSDEEKEKIEKRGRGYSIEDEDADGDGNQEHYLKTSGCIQLFRPEFTNSQLRYVEEETLKEYESGNKSFDDVKGKYSIDTSGNLIIPQKKTEKYIQGEEEKQNALLDLTQEDNYDWDSFNNRTPTDETITRSLQTIPYQSSIASYSMPFEFLTILTTFTQNSEYGVAVAELVSSESYIKLNILDNSKTTEERYMYQYNSHTKVKYKIGAKTIIPDVALWIGYTGNMRDYVDETDRQMLWKPDDYNYETETPYIYRENTITTEYTTTLQLGEAKTWFSKKTNSYDVDEVDAHLDDSVEVNPQISTPPPHGQFNFSISDQDNYVGTQDLYDTNSNFKDFIDNYYKRDTGEWWVSDFKDDLLENFDKNTMKDYVDTYVDNHLMEKFYQQELNLSYSPTGPNPAIFPLSPPKDEYYDNLIQAIDDYKNEDTNWKIDSNSYDVMPYNINNKREQEKVKIGYYVSEKNYMTTSAGPADDNTDAFLNLLVTGTGNNKKYVYYRVDSGENKAPGADMVSAPDMLFDLLAGNTKTANLENAMKYILYKMTGEDYGVTDFNSALTSMSAKSVGSNYDVADQSVWITSKTDLEKGIKSLGLGSQAEQNLLNNVDAFLEMQQTYHVNAALAISVAVAESSAGTNWAAIDPSTYNWMSITGDYNGQSIDGWRKYPSFREATLDFGELISGSIYCGGGNTTISQIGNIYCPNTPEYPTQADTWIANTQATMTKILKAGGVDLSSYSGGSIIECAEEIHAYMEQNNYFYSLDTTGILKATFEESKSTKGTCCATFVSWVLREAGLIDQTSHSAPGLASLLENTYHWTRVNANQLQAGDVMVYNYGHVEIYAGDGTIYNAGSDNAIKNAAPSAQWNTPDYGLRAPQ